MTNASESSRAIRLCSPEKKPLSNSPPTRPTFFPPLSPTPKIPLTDHQPVLAAGIYRNTYVLWELYGPEKEDYTDFWKERWDVTVSEKGKSATAEIKFNIDKPGNYRLRVSTTDVAGRSTVVWKEITVND